MNELFSVYIYLRISGKKYNINFEKNKNKKFYSTLTPFQNAI